MSEGKEFHSHMDLGKKENLENILSINFGYSVLKHMAPICVLVSLFGTEFLIPGYDSVCTLLLICFSFFSFLKYPIPVL